MVTNPHQLDEHPAAAAMPGALLDQDDALADTEGLLDRVIEQFDRMIDGGFDWRAHTLRMHVDHTRGTLTVLRHRLLPFVTGADAR
jgi:hypothetical protein